MPPRTLPSASALAGTGSLICLLLGVAVLSLGLSAYDQTGSFDIFDATDPARFGAMREVWGLFLAAQIVRTVLAAALLATVWAVHLALPAGGRSVAALVAGSVGGVLSIVAARQGIVAAGELGGGIGPSNGALVAALAAAGLVCIAAWIALTALAAWRGAGLPRPMRDAGLAVAALALAAAAWPPAWLAFALGGVVWWIGLARLLLGGRPRPAR